MRLATDSKSVSRRDAPGRRKILRLYIADKPSRKESFLKDLASLRLSERLDKLNSYRFLEDFDKLKFCRIQNALLKLELPAFGYQKCGFSFLL